MYMYKKCNPSKFCVDYLQCTCTCTCNTISIFTCTYAYMLMYTCMHVHTYTSPFCSDIIAFATEPVFVSLANVLGYYDNLPSPLPLPIKV